MARVTTTAQRVALVTGARRGIGAAIACGLAAPGMTIVLHHLGEHEQTADVADRCRKLGAVAHVAEADLRSPDQIKQMSQWIIDTAGGVDVLVNNAARPANAAWGEISLDDWQQTIHVNLTAPLLLVQNLAPTMQVRRWGRVINITSGTVRAGGPSGVAYISSKAGLVGLTRSLAQAVSPRPGDGVDAGWFFR